MANISGGVSSTSFYFYRSCTHRHHHLLLLLLLLLRPCSQRPLHAPNTSSLLLLLLLSVVLLLLLPPPPVSPSSAAASKANGQCRRLAARRDAHARTHVPVGGHQHKVLADNANEKVHGAATGPAAPRSNPGWPNMTRAEENTKASVSWLETWTAQRKWSSVGSLERIKFFLFFPGPSIFSFILSFFYFSFILLSFFFFFFSFFFI